MKSWNVILGVDVSKLTLDICWAEHNLHIRIDNCAKGFAVFKKWCKTNEIDLKGTLVVLEYTGGYEYRFMQFCESLSISYCRIPGLEIKQSMGMSYLFVSHDLNVVRLLCDRVIVMRAGRIVEKGSSERVLGDPQDAYTKELLTAIPHPPLPVH